MISMILILIIGPVLSQVASSGPAAIVRANAETPGNGQHSAQGLLTFVYGDGLQSNGETRYYLSMTGGTRVRLLFASPPSFAFFSKTVVVRGATPTQRRLENNRIETTMLVDSVSLPQGKAEGQPQGESNVTFSAMTGTKRMIILLLKYSDDSSVPHDVSYYTNLMNPGSGNTVNAFYQATSWSQLSVQADTTPSWLTLPHPKSWYAPCGWSSACADLDAVGNDGITLANPTVNFASYDMISFVLSNDLDCCAWGGGWYDTLDGVTKVWGATWMPPWSQDAGTYSHEVGHSIGAPHSGWVYWAYDSYWDVMSGGDAFNGVSCGSYNSRNSGGTNTLWCYTPGDMIAAYKDMLGWIDSSHVLTVASGESVTTTVDSLAASLGANYKMLKLCISGYSCVSGGDTSRYLTIEVRTSIGYDQYRPREGVIIHMFRGDRPPVSGTCFFNSQSGPAYPIDSTPGDYDSVNCDSDERSYPNYALFNAEWAVGQEYSDSSTLGTNRRLIIVSKTGTSPSPVTFTIQVAPYAVGVTVTSNPRTGSGYVTVDGAPIVTPHTFDWDVGSTHTLTANSPVSCGSGCQSVWLTWSDSGAQTHVITVPSSPTSYSANYKAQYQLTMNPVSPSGGGTTDPVAGGSYWYDSGTLASVSATAASGYSFYYWSLDGTNVGTNPSYSVLMDTAHALTAFFRGSSSISLSSSVAPDGYAFILSGTITPSQPSPGIPADTPVTLSLSSDGGTTWNNIIAVQTNSTAGYSVYWLAPYRYTDWRVRASWSGNAAYAGATSTSLNLGGTYGPFYRAINVFATGPNSVPRGGSATFDVQVKCSPSSAGVYRTLYILVTGPDGYQYIDTVTAMVNIGETKAYQFTWEAPSTLTPGTYQVYFGLIPPYATAISQTQITVM